MALDTANDVITHVPWLELTPMSPEMAGIDTFAIDVSSTIMNVAADSAIVPATRARPQRRMLARGGGAGAGPAHGRAAAVARGRSLSRTGERRGQRNASRRPPALAMHAGGAAGAALRRALRVHERRCRSGVRRRCARLAAIVSLHQRLGLCGFRGERVGGVRGAGARRARERRPLRVGDVHLRDHRQSEAQRMLGQLLRVEHRRAPARAGRP